MQAEAWIGPPGPVPVRALRATLPAVLGHLLVSASISAAKGLALCFSLMAALYLMAWLRGFVAAEAGWVARVFLFLPGITRWSHAVMLNVPAMAFGPGHSRWRACAC